MKCPRVQFTVRRMMLAVAVSALLMGVEQRRHLAQRQGRAG